MCRLYERAVRRGKITEAHTANVAARPNATLCVWKLSRSLARPPNERAVCWGEITGAALPTWRRVRKRRCACGSSPRVGSTSVWARSVTGENNRSGTANVAARPIGALRVRKFPLRWFDFCLGAQSAGVKEPRPRRQRGGASESGAARAAVSRSLVRLPFGRAACRGEITEAALPTCLPFGPFRVSSK